MQRTSTRNPLLQEIRRAASGGRSTEDGCLIVEGPHLVEEALRGSWKLEHVVTTAQGRERYRELLARIDAEVIETPARTFATVSATESSQEILAMVRPRRASWEAVVGGRGLVVVLDGIQDPGNAGTIVRSAEAFGASGVVFAQGSVHWANGKFLRATAGSIFRLPALEAVTRGEIMSRLAAAGVRLYVLAARASAVLTAADLVAPCALIVGSEASGASAELAAGAQAIAIPAQRVESLNAAVACSIALFEAARQRGQQ